MTDTAYRLHVAATAKAAVFGLRVVTAGLLAGVGAIHLDLWASFGYRYIPNIGWLFLLASVSAFVLCGLMVVAPRRLLAWPACAAILLFTGLLGGLLVSLNGGLLGFRETTSAPLFAQAVTTEALGVMTGAALTLVLHVVTGRSRSAQVGTSTRSEDAHPSR